MGNLGIMGSMGTGPDCGTAYYTTGEFAARLRLKTSETVRGMCVRGEIPGAFRVGRQWRIPRASEGVFVQTRQAAERPSRALDGDPVQRAWERRKLVKEVKRAYRGERKKEGLKLIADFEAERVGEEEVRERVKQAEGRRQKAEGEDKR